MNALRRVGIDVPAGEEVIGLAFAEEGAPNDKEKTETIARLLIARKSAQELLFWNDTAQRIYVGAKFVESWRSILERLACAHRIKADRFYLPNPLASDT